MPTNYLPDDPYDLAILASGVVLLIMGGVLLVRRLRGAGEAFPFVAREMFVDPVRSWWPVVRSAVGDDGLVVPAVSMPQLLAVAEGTPRKRSRLAAAELARRQVDFAIFDAATLEPKVALLLQTPERPRTFCRAALQAAGWEVIALPAAQIPTADDLRGMLFAGRHGPETMEEVGAEEAWMLGAIDADAVASAEWMLGDETAPAEKGVPSAAENAASSGPWPSCPQCGAQQAPRRVSRGRHAGRAFLVCSRYPTCQQLQPLSSRQS